MCAGSPGHGPRRRRPLVPRGGPGGRGDRAGTAPPPDRSFHERSDIGLRRLLFALRDDTRVQGTRSGSWAGSSTTTPATAPAS
ncbi:hypothetical protein LV779_02205 [Streptomyces thinghirensis]|nr:hypothetical protein [Streptomyces thinghirensis]